MLATTSRRCFVCSARWLVCSRQILRCTGEHRRHSSVFHIALYKLFISTALVSASVRPPTVCPSEYSWLVSFFFPVSEFVIILCKYCRTTSLVSLVIISITGSSQSLVFCPCTSTKSFCVKCSEQSVECLVGTKSCLGFSRNHRSHNSLFCGGNE